MSVVNLCSFPSDLMRPSSRCMHILLRVISKRKIIILFSANLHDELLFGIKPILEGLCCPLEHYDFTQRRIKDSA